MIYSGMEWCRGWRVILYTAVWNGIVVGARLYIQRYGMLLWLEGDSIYSGMNVIVVRGRLNIQRYGMLLWLE